MPERFPQRFSSQLLTILGTQTCLGVQVLATVANGFDLALGQSEWAASCVGKMRRVNNEAVDHIFDLKDKQERFITKLLTVTDLVSKLQAERKCPAVDFVAAGLQRYAFRDQLA